MSTSGSDLGDLALLVRVAQLGSLGRVAEEVGLSQPSLSRRMARLERGLRLTLLQRGPRGTTLTPSGRVVVDWAEEVLGAARRFEESVAVLREHRSSTLRVAASMTIAEHLAPTWLSRLRDVEPDAVVAMSVTNSTDVADAVEHGRADLGFVESPTIRRSVRRRRLAWDHLVVVVADPHPWAGRTRPVTAADLAREPLLVREPGSGTRETLDEALRTRGLELTPAQVLASNAALKSSALVGIGPAVLSALAVVDELGSGRLVAVGLQDLDLRRPLSVVWRDGVQLPPVADVLVRLAAGRSR
ncbi:LysR family transcriptional regulator [Nocardioides marmoribigeumensis]|uniref:DNA-binding transcriptional LysR family regulator n=1 Tax=Nocardioides marmoribigeumensis TaxID=433649 RepID=A0ABU2BXT5_9ACTN|nr:LysR family transcriptional regulator [Nocardioides marmoribigeumensis]MDR7363205.1 DNA-binding transcriptional LysR family regulator [Nocardioides marmoribigeumensis]